MLDTQARVLNSDRIEALRRSGLLSISPRDQFGHLTEHVRDVLDAPVAVISLVDEHRQIFAGHSGLPEPWASLGETPISHSFCQHVVNRNEPLDVEDARVDPLVRGNGAIRDLDVIAYLGVPLTLPGGEVAGALAAIDSRPRVWTDADMRRLRSIAHMVEKEMATRIAEARWRSLFEGLHEGFILGRVVRDEQNRIVDWRYEEVNDAWHDLVGVPRGTAVGRTILEVFPGIEDAWVDEFAEVVRTGEPIRFTRQVGTLGRWYDGVAQSIGDDRFTVIFLEVTDRVQGEARRAAMTDAVQVLGPLNEPDEMAAAAARIIGRALGVGRVGYGTVADDGETFTVPRDWTAEGYPTLAGTYRMDDYGGYAEDLRQGRTVVIPDIRVDPRTAGDVAPLESVSVRSLINLPIVENGRTVAVLYVNDDEVRDWRPEEVAFVADAAGRMRSAIERRRAEDELREREAFLSSVLASSSDCIKVLDLDAKLVFMSEGGQRVMEVSDFNAVEGCPWPDFWQAEGNIAAKEAIALAQAGEPSAFQGYADTMKGNRRYWDVQVSPILGPDGKPERILSVSRDITALKASEEARAVLNQELSHRMKNLLAMVQAITAQTMRQAKTMEEASEAVFTRISALGRAQDILTRASFNEADVAEIVAAAVGPHQTVDERIEWTGPRYGLNAQQALGLSLAIHELATNAAKYGALSNEAGRVAMSWSRVDSAFVFRWIESGGPSVTAPERRGFGSKLIERIVASYFDGEGRIDFAPAGIQFKLTGAPERSAQGA